MDRVDDPKIADDAGGHGPARSSSRSRLPQPKIMEQHSLRSIRKQARWRDWAWQRPDKGQEAQRLR
eukprot:8418930-Alexandrium_andersonii.AAC.1